MAIPGNGTIPMDPFAEALASVPQVQRKRTAGDGTEPGGTAGQSKNITAQTAQTLETSAATEGQEAPSIPTLEDASDPQAFLTIDQLSKSQDRLRRNRWAIDQYHSWLDANVAFGKLDKVPNQNVWVAKLPPGITGERGSAVPNKAADLCNKVTDALLADPPKPNPQPHVDDETADAAADLASEFLRQNAGEAGINEVQQYRWALRNALTRSTSFLEYDIDAEGGGYQAYQVMAHPQATDQDLTAAMQAGEEPLVATGPDGQPMPTVNPLLRYVSAPTPEFPFGQFVEDASQADRVWLPKLIVRRHQRTKVLTFPATAAIEDAKALLLTDYCTLAEGRDRWKDTVGTMDAAELAGLASWKPYFSDMIVPFTFRGGIADGMTGPGLDDVGSMSPLLQRRMYFHRLVIRKSSEYPKALQIDITGAKGGFRLGQRSLDYTVTLPTSGKTTRCRDIPFVQITPNQDVSDQDPMGWPFEARFDGSAQADSTLISHYLDALERMANPHVFIRSLTAVDEDEWFDRSKPIVIGPSDQPPFYEQFPPLPPAVQFSEYLQTRQDTSSGLTATAQGLDSENSQSGIAKRLTVRQAQISLAGIQQQLHAAYTRGWRISCQWAQAEYKIPQLVQASGENASNEEQWWTGEDFAGIDDIGIEPGTGTFMTAEDKANYVAFMQGQLWLDPEKAADIAVVGIARDLGLPTDVTIAMIERATAAWLKGPPKPKAPEVPEIDPLTGQPKPPVTWEQQWDAYAQGKQAQDAMMASVQQADAQVQQQAAATGQPAPPPSAPPIMAPLPPKPWSPFPDLPCNTSPEVARKWTKRLEHLMMSPRYAAMSPQWQACLNEFYMEERQAFAIATSAAPNSPQAGQPGAQQAAAKKPPQIPGSSGTNGPPNSQPKAA